MSTLTLEEVKQIVKTKSPLYNAMIRNGFYLPKKKATIVNEAYLQKVKSGEFYCPKFTDVIARPCPDPPSREILLDEVVKATTKVGKDIGASEGKLPDIPWLLTVLAIHCPDHEVFHKDYLPPLPVPKKSDMVIDNSDGFYTNLPQLYKKKDLKSISKLKQY